MVTKTLRHLILYNVVVIAHKLVSMDFNLEFAVTMLLSLDVVVLTAMLLVAVNADN